jgi:hypothetical protein
LKPLEHLQRTPNEFKDACHLLTANPSTTRRPSRIGTDLNETPTILSFLSAQALRVIRLAIPWYMQKFNIAGFSSPLFVRSISRTRSTKLQRDRPVDFNPIVQLVCHSRSQLRLLIERDDLLLSRLRIGQVDSDTRRLLGELVYSEEQDRESFQRAVILGRNEENIDVIKTRLSNEQALDTEASFLPA